MNKPLLGLVIFLSVIITYFALCYTFSKDAPIDNSIVAPTQVSAIVPITEPKIEPEITANSSKKWNPEKASGSIKVSHTIENVDSKKYTCKILISALHDVDNVNITYKSLKNILFEGETEFQHDHMKANTSINQTINALVQNGDYGEFVVYVQGTSNAGKKTSANYQISLGKRPPRDTDKEGTIDTKRNEVVMPAKLNKK